jgi:hypothetical protein
MNERRRRKGKVLRSHFGTAARKKFRKLKTISI